MQTTCGISVSTFIDHVKPELPVVYIGSLRRYLLWAIEELAHERGRDSSPGTPPGKYAHEASEVPSVIEPVDSATLAARRPVILAKHRARRLAKPAYANSDASWRDGVVGVAYVSGALSNRTALVACSGSSEAEYLALRMAMEDADRAQLPGPVDFRVDSTAVAHLACGTSADLTEVRARVKRLLAEHREWRLAFFERKRNWVADGMARRTLRRWQAHVRHEQQA